MFMKVDSVRLLNNFSFKANYGIDYKKSPDDVMLNHYTYFFRYYRDDESIRDYILDTYSDKPEINLLCAGCSSGEEAYSWAMILDDYKDKVKISAFDKSDECISTAKNGTYKLDGIEEYRLLDERNSHSSFEKECYRKFHKYFKPTDKKDCYQLDNEAFKNCRFFSGDLANTDEYFKPDSLDVIFCRNVLYHFTNYHAKLSQHEYMIEDSEKINYIINKMSKVLKKGGIIVFSKEESNWGIDTEMLKLIIFKNGFSPVDFNWESQNKKIKQFILQGDYTPRMQQWCAPYIYKKVANI